MIDPCETAFVNDNFDAADEPIYKRTLQSMTTTVKLGSPIQQYFGFYADDVSARYGNG